MESLKSFSLFGVKTVLDYSPLENVPTLDTLDVSANGLASLKTIAGPPGLDALFVSFNDLGSLEGLDAFPNLTRLLAEECGLEVISALAGLMDPSELSLRNNEIVVIEPILQHGGISAGDKVDLRDNPLDCDLVGDDLQQLKDKNVDVLSDCP